MRTIPRLRPRWTVIELRPHIPGQINATYWTDAGQWHPKPECAMAMTATAAQAWAEWCSENPRYADRTYAAAIIYDRVKSEAPRKGSR